MKNGSPDKNSSRRNLLRYVGLAGTAGFTGFTGLNFGSESAIAEPTGAPRIVDGTNPGERSVSPYDIEYQNLDTSHPITVTYVFTDSKSDETTSVHSVSLSGEPASGTVSTGSHSVTVPSGDVQVGIEVSHPSLPSTLSTGSSNVTTISADAIIIDGGKTVSDAFDGKNYAGQKAVSSYNINYEGLDTTNPITVTYVFTDSSDTEYNETHTVDISGKSESDTVSTGSHSISVPHGTLELDIELSHESLESPEITNVGSIGEVYPNNVDGAGGTTVVDKTIGGQDYRIHAFENVGSSTFTVNSTPPAATVDVLVVGGGGGGGAGFDAGGGGAGGVVSETDVNVSPQNYNITVGAGGEITRDNNKRGDNGEDSTAFGLTAIGGGGGGSHDGYSVGASNGGSGGGGSRHGNRGVGIQTGSTDGGYGSDGGSGENNNGGGGGGATQAGQSVGWNVGFGGYGGDGIDFSSTFGTSFGENGVFGGGGGGGESNNPGAGGLGGGGNGNSDSTSGVSGQHNTGGGCGGVRTRNGSPSGGVFGGSGIVLIRYEI